MHAYIAQKITPDANLASGFFLKCQNCNSNLECCFNYSFYFCA